MLLVLENETLNLIDPLGQTVLHSQPIVSIRVWGVGRDNGRSVSRQISQISSKRSQRRLKTNGLLRVDSFKKSFSVSLVGLF